MLMAMLDSACLPSFFVSISNHRGVESRGPAAHDAALTLALHSSPVPPRTDSLAHEKAALLRAARMPHGSTSRAGVRHLRGRSDADLLPTRCPLLHQPLLAHRLDLRLALSPPLAQER